MGPNEVDIKDLQSLPNASEKDGAAPAIQKYAEPPKAQVCYCAIIAIYINWNAIQSLVSYIICSAQTFHAI